MPFAIMLATIRTLTHMNITNELLAMIVSGIKFKTLMIPFLIMAGICTLLIYCNFEFVMPRLSAQENTYKTPSSASPEQPSLHVLHLQDGSTILYQRYNETSKHFFDIFWIRSPKDIVHVKYLYPFEKKPKGYYVDHCIRDNNGDFVRAKSLENEVFNDMIFDSSYFYATVTPTKNLAPSTLIKEAYNPLNITHNKQDQFLTWFYFKIAISLVCILAVIGPATFCFRFDRNVPVFMIYAMSIFALVALFTIMDAAAVLGESGTYSPISAIAIPMLCYFGFFGIRFLKTT